MAQLHVQPQTLLTPHTSGAGIAQRALRILRRAALGVACLVLGTLLFLYGPQALSTFAEYPALAITGVGLSIAYITLRGLALRSAASAAGVHITLLQGVRIFCEGVCVELTCWPGKLAADAHRVHVLGSTSLRDRVTAIVIFRSASITSSMFFLLVAIGLGTLGGTFDTRAAAALLIAWTLGAFLLSRRRQSLRPLSVLPTFTSVMASILAHACDAALFAMLAAEITGASPIDAAAWFVLIGTLAAGSMVPLGIGVLDTACVIVLVAHFGAHQPAAITVVLAYRFLGPALTLLAGLIFLLKRETLRVVPRDTQTLGVAPDGNPLQSPILIECQHIPHTRNPPQGLARSR